MKEVLLYFFGLGSFGFGGPLAIIARIQADLVEKRKWLSPTEFRSAFAMIKAMPGPVAFQMVVFIAQKRAGRLAGLLAGVMYILPSFVMMVLFAEFLGHYQGNSQIQSVLKGLACASFALIAIAARTLTKDMKAVPSFWIITAISLFGLIRGVPESLVILGCGIFEFLRWKQKQSATLFSSVPLDLFLVCLKAGALVFGTGLAILPLLQTDIVDTYKWLEASEFLTAISLGQVTPGPVVIAVVYVGYKILGFSGALIAAIGIFLPSALHMLTWFPRALSWMNRQKWIEVVSRAVVAAVFAALILVLYHIGLGFSQTQVLLGLVLGLILHYGFLGSLGLVFLGGATGFFL